MVTIRSRLIQSLTFVLIVMLFRTSQAIQGGREIDITEAPWTVAVTAGKHLCGGAILKPTFVLTAARCTFEMQPWPIKVHYGSKEVASVGTYVDVKRAIPLGFKFETLQNNIAVLELSEPIKLDNTTSKEIDLPTLMFDPTIGTDVLVSGWGAAGQTYSKNLLGANFTVVNREECEKRYKEHGLGDYVTDEIFCAGGNQGEKCLDIYDEGDPAVQDNKIVGIGFYIASFCHILPSLFTRVGTYVDAIKAIIDQ
ncbi:Sar s 3 allergen (serine protease-like protein 9) [Sarcoptes scabiei]|uniref:Sar s 3 allergen (Serine protease-like protein 9) n=1 Tax=Sarcoptes scabiei TaxID=52283 RepID=A0A132AL68_SARSC|nr:Sar s 3 allergen (serine protease-like protein 9) [Sarcoptes scabiei]